MLVGGPSGQPALLSLLLVLVKSFFCSAISIDEEQKKMVMKEKIMQLRRGGRRELVLKKEEEMANKRLMIHKKAEMKQAMKSRNSDPACTFSRPRISLRKVRCLIS